MAVRETDALVIGAGYYGCSIALELRRLGVADVTIAESESGIMTRASWANQARVHGGYHYPRSVMTGLSSRRNFERFIEDHRDAIEFSTPSYYAIARSSMVNPNQFERFCRTVGAPLSGAPSDIVGMFDASLVEAVYSAAEFCFNANLIAERVSDNLKRAKVKLLFGHRARYLESSNDVSLLNVGRETIKAPIVFNCSYSALDEAGVPLRATLRKELAEIALISPPRQIESLAVTLMDGPFFSTIPFPALALHSLSHVRYTPVTAWTDIKERQIPMSFRTGVGRPTNANAMLRDAARYLPSLEKATVESSFYEYKAVLAANDHDDGRPILFETSPENPNFISVLGGKIDNIYDILESLPSVVRDIAA